MKEPLGRKSDITPALQSVRLLARGQAEDIHPNRIDPARPKGDAEHSSASRHGLRLVTRTKLAIMNGHAVSCEPRPGGRLTIVRSR